MTNLYVSYCPSCGSDLGIATLKKELLTEIKFNCSTCNKQGKASETIIKEINKLKWQEQKEYYEN